jgi:hypothetical protein
MPAISVGPAGKRSSGSTSPSRVGLQRGKKLSRAGTVFSSMIRSLLDAGLPQWRRRVYDFLRPY